MEILAKNPLILYGLCLLLITAPAYYVFVNYPSIKGQTTEKQEQQIILISGIGAIPFLGVLFVFFLEYYNKKGRKIF
jgi:hypothetical protein